MSRYDRRLAAGLPVWAYVATSEGDPHGPSYRGRCLECPWDGPIRRVPLARCTDEVLAAAWARPPSGPIYEAERAAEADLGRHLWRTHAIRVKPRPAERMRTNLGRPPA